MIIKVWESHRFATLMQAVKHHHNVDVLVLPSSEYTTKLTHTLVGRIGAQNGQHVHFWKEVWIFAQS